MGLDCFWVAWEMMFGLKEGIASMMLKDHDGVYS
jgi:hypothetical protein